MTMQPLPFAADAPVSVSKVGIKARDLAALADYYRTVVGLEDVSRRPGAITLGAGGRPLLEIEEFGAARPDDPRSAGLFHTAFLLPSRAELARWVRRTIDARIPVTGASDHLVSEAIYLDDPEGNGIEIYADRAPEAWQHEGGRVKMATEPLDVPGLLADLRAGDAPWSRAPDNTMVGHVHLRVGEAAAAQSWWGGELGFETMAQYGADAVFLATGGYHHHVGANAWRSRGAGRRDNDRSGLSFVEFKSRRATGETELTDPWGNSVRIVPAGA
jgi:catechol 2,3-dioxygenase